AASPTRSIPLGQVSLPRIRLSQIPHPPPPPATASRPSAARMTEAPFLPRERLFKQQQIFQNLTKHTYLKGRYDVVTSVAIPLALAATSMFMIGRGVYNMSHGIGKKE
uniref:COX VIIa-like protein n=3 Tax=Setaria TaxID=4554 RepID=K3ZZ91_SETIT